MSVGIRPLRKRLQRLSSYARWKWVERRHKKPSKESVDSAVSRFIKETGTSKSVVETRKNFWLSQADTCRTIGDLAAWRKNMFAKAALPWELKVDMLHSGFESIIQNLAERALSNPENPEHRNKLEILVGQTPAEKIIIDMARIETKRYRADFGKEMREAEEEAGRKSRKAFEKGEEGKEKNR